MTITYLGHACFLLESGGYRVILDPCKGVPGVRDTECEAEAVYCSHGHFDHCYTEKISIKENTASPFSVRQVASFHDDAQGAKRGENTIHVLTAEGITVAHLGDLGHALSTEQVEAIGTCDVLLLPVGGTYTLDCRDAKEAADMISPRVICPMHYRRGEIGFEALQTIEEFTAQYCSGDVHMLAESTLELSEDILRRGGIVVLQA